MTNMKNIKMTKFSTILIAIIVVLCICLFVILPLWKQWGGMEKRIESLNLQYIRSSKTVGHFEDSLQQYWTYEEKIKQTRSDEEEVAIFLKEIESFINNLNITINDIKPLSGEKRDNANMLLISVELNSSMQDLIGLLHNIAASQTLISVEKMNITITNQRQNIMSVQFIFSKTFIA